MDHGISFPAGCEGSVRKILDELPPSAVRLLGRLEMRCLGSLGHCREKMAGLSEYLGVSDRQVRRLLAVLEARGLVVKTRRRIRWAERSVTALGSRVLSLLRRGPRAAPAPISPGDVRADVRAHGNAQNQEETIPGGDPSLEGGKRTRVDAAAYCLPRRRCSLQRSTWSILAEWLNSAGSVTWARCRLVHEAFLGLSAAVERSAEWSGYSRVTGIGRGETLVRLAVLEAVRCRRDFGTVETAMAWVTAVVRRCVAEFQTPGVGR